MGRPARRRARRVHRCDRRAAALGRHRHRLGAAPQAGLFASVVGGILVSALGGSRFQIGGPAGAFIMLVATTIEAHGYGGFLAATIMAGALLIAIGYLRLGSYIKYIPHSVVVGFAASIAVIIFTSSSG